MAAPTAASILPQWASTRASANRISLALTPVW